jgi:outer membrane protein, heavy metal efflux system
MRPTVLIWCIVVCCGPACTQRHRWLTDEALAAALGPEMAACVSLQLHGLSTDVEPLTSNVLTLELAIREALRTSPSIQSALARVLIARADSQQARLLPNPILTIALRFPESGGQPIIEAGLAAELLSLLQQPGRISAADHRLRATSFEAVTIVLDVLTEVQEQYASAQAFESRISILRERQRIVARLTELADARLNAGEGTRLDLTTFEAEAAQLQVEMAQTELSHRQAMLALARLIGRPGQNVDWEIALWQPPTLNTTDESRWVMTALVRRPEIQSQISRLAALGVEVNLTRWAILEREGEWSVGPAISAPLPIMDWGQAKRRKAEAQRLEAMHELTAVRRSVIQEVRAAYAVLQTARQSLSAANDRLVPLLERRRGEAEAIYKAGQSDAVALLLAEQDFHAGGVIRIELQQAATEAVIRLHRAAGGPGHAPGNYEQAREVAP